MTDAILYSFNLDSSHTIHGPSEPCIAGFGYTSHANILRLLSGLILIGDAFTNSQHDT